MDWSEYTLITLMTKSPANNQRGSPYVWIGTFHYEELDLCPLEVVGEQLRSINGLAAGLNVLSEPEETVLGGAAGYAATYSYLYESEQQDCYIQLEEFSVVRVAGELLIAIFGGPADSLTEQVRQELMEIRASVSFSVDDLSGESDEAGESS